MDTAEETNRTPRRTGARERLLVGATVGLAITAGVFAFLYWESSDTSSAEIDRYLGTQATEIERTATEIAELLTNYDADSIDEVGDRLLGLTTGEFRSDYEELLPGLGPALERARVSSTGEIIGGPDVSFSTADEAVARVTVEQSIRGTTDPRGRKTVVSMRFTFVLDEDEWTADGFALDGD